MDFQALVDGMNARHCAERAETQMTLGKLIAALEAMPEGTQVQAMDEPHSYRGYYSDLSFEPLEGVMPAADLLKIARECMGEVFQGYKGGDFPMHANSPIWLAYEGSCGKKIMGFTPDGSLVLQDDE